MRNATAVPTSTRPISVVKIGNSAPPHKLRISEMKNTASNTSSAGWDREGFLTNEQCLMRAWPGKKELLNRFKRNGRRISPDPDSAKVVLFSRGFFARNYHFLQRTTGVF